MRLQYVLRRIMRFSRPNLSVSAKHRMQSFQLTPKYIPRQDPDIWQRYPGDHPYGKVSSILAASEWSLIPLTKPLCLE